MEWFESLVGSWGIVVAYVAGGLACAARAVRTPAERWAWACFATGLVLYAAGSAVYNVQLADGGAAFPTRADALWLSLYPLSAAGMVGLVRARHVQVSASLWLDALIGASVVAAVCAVFLLDPILETSAGAGWTGAAQLAYTVFDLLLMGFAVALWGAGRWRLDTWFALASAFALIAVCDVVYLAAQTGEGWTPGGIADVGYVAGAALFAAAAHWSRAPQRAGAPSLRVALPIAFTVTAFALVSYEAFSHLDALAVVLIRLTLFAVVLRLGLTLWWLSRQRADLEELAASDPLTGLGNYRAFQERLAREVAHAGGRDDAVAIVMLDLDHFKALNDTFGHAEGDRVLQATATMLSRTVGEEGFVARVGGEEFGILLPGAGASAAAAVAERCRAAVAGLSASGPPLACSAGVAAYPAHTTSVGQLLHAADGALYWAKRSGRDRVRVFDPRHVVALSLHEQRREVELLLAGAEPVTPVFQPVMEVATGRVAGYEALARFTGPHARPPHLWFAQAHRAGLGPALEAAAIRAALAVPGRPAGTFLAVNVSPAALLSTDVQQALPFDLDGITIELTEHDAFDEDGALELELAALRERGARIALDDAGAGYAGLQQLIRLRPDVVKVDRSLVAQIHADPSKLALLQALAGFASTTGAAVCAEGVEELSELRALASIDVTYAQGYALARPAAPWADIPAAVAAEAASADEHGMRLAGVAEAGAEASLGELTDVLARVSTVDELKAALDGVIRQLGAEEAAISRLDAAAGVLITVSDHEWSEEGERWRLEDYPATEHAIATQAIGQVIAGDPASDPAELKVLEEAGMCAVLLMPLVSGGATIALLEIYRRAPQAWTKTQVDRARVLANHIAASLARVWAAEGTRKQRTPRPRPAPR
jgi:diguanylate cyclase (GGDEF)-like protein